MMSETEKEIDDFLKIFGTSLRHYTFGDTKQRAITAWNTRTPDPRVMNLVEAARVVVKAYDDYSGYEPSVSILMRSADVDLRAALSSFNGDGK